MSAEDNSMQKHSKADTLVTQDQLRIPIISGAADLSFEPGSIATNGTQIFVRKPDGTVATIS
jgi:hypothetical protein